MQIYYNILLELKFFFSALASHLLLDWTNDWMSVLEKKTIPRGLFWRIQIALFKPQNGRIYWPLILHHRNSSDWSCFKIQKDSCCLPTGEIIIILCANNRPKVTFTNSEEPAALSRSTLEMQSQFSLICVKINCPENWISGVFTYTL